MRIAVRVKPGSKQPGMAVENGMLILRVRERAVEGAANEACILALASALQLAPSRIILLSGARARDKRFAIEGVDEADVRRRLGFGV